MKREGFEGADAIMRCLAGLASVLTVTRQVSMALETGLRDVREQVAECGRVHVIDGAFEECDGDGIGQDRR